MTVKPTYEELEKRIQELEKAESERNLAEDRLIKIFDNTQDAIFIHDLEGKILDVNDKMCRLYGLTKEEGNCSISYGSNLNRSLQLRHNLKRQIFNKAEERLIWL